jgi:hypothetical protein
MAAGMAKPLAILQKNRPDIIAKLKRKELPVTELLKDMTAISQPVIE